jgi:hypothetical protein
MQGVCFILSDRLNRKDKEINISVFSACPVKFTIVKSKVYPVKQVLQFTFNWGSFHRGDSVVNEKKQKTNAKRG